MAPTVLYRGLKICQGKFSEKEIFLNYSDLRFTTAATAPLLKKGS